MSNPLLKKTAVPTYRVYIHEPSLARESIGFEITIRRTPPIMLLDFVIAAYEKLHRCKFKGDIAAKFDLLGYSTHERFISVQRKPKTRIRRR